MDKKVERAKRLIDCMVQRIERTEKLLDSLIEGAKRFQRPSIIDNGLWAFDYERELIAAKKHLERGNFDAVIKCLKRAESILLDY